jgi:hypothetical protein
VTVTTIVSGLMRTGSILNVQVKGDKPREFGWFSALGSLPLISMDADRAARQIVAAPRQGTPERILGLPANLAVRAGGLAPNLTIRLLALTARFLPALKLTYCSLPDGIPAVGLAVPAVAKPKPTAGDPGLSWAITAALCGMGDLLVKIQSTAQPAGTVLPLMFTSKIGGLSIAS